MAGICGTLSLRGAAPNPDHLNRMVATLHHRGTGDDSYVLSGPCGLIARPLLSSHESAQQPIGMTWQDVTAWIIHDGHGYNYRDIAAALRATGVPLTTGSDAETLLGAYLRYGPANFIKAFRGMFAFALWDESRQRLFLARDRLGQKPLYVAFVEDTLLFGSEMKAILAHPEMRRALNTDLIPYTLAYGYTPSPVTLFDGINSLQPGQMVTIDVSGDKPDISFDTYWHPPYPTSGSDPRDERDIAADLLAHLRGSVRLRTQDADQVGAFLSGGFDSTATVALLSEQAEQQIQTYSLSIKDYTSFDERRFARQVAARYLTNHHEFEFDDDLPNVIETLVRVYDHPFGDTSALLTYALSRHIKEESAIAFTGDGASELFAGLPQMRLARLARDYDRLPDVAHRAIGGVMDRLPDAILYGGLMRQANTIVQAADLPVSARYLSWTRAIPAGWFQALMGGANEDLVQKHFASMLNMKEANADAVAHLLDLNIRSFLPDNLLMRLDRCGMAHSLEIRTPFLDHQLIHFVSTIPSQLKLKRGTAKAILKLAMADLLPETIIERKSQDVVFPLDDWFRGQWASYIEDRLLGSDAMLHQFMDRTILQLMVNAHKTGEEDLGQALWTLLTFEVWLRAYFPDGL